MDALFTRDEFMQLPEGFPAQLVEGQLVKEPPRSVGHQRLVGMISIALRDAAPGRSVPGPLDVAIDRLNVYWPDVVAFASPPDPEERPVEAPLLVVEVLAPATEDLDRGIKCMRYLGAGAREVWLIDPSDKRIEICSVRGTWPVTGSATAASMAVPAFELVPAELFAP